MRLALLSAACQQVTFILVESWLFRGLRETLARRSEHLGRLVSCHLCSGMWVGLALAALFRPAAVPPPRLHGHARALATYVLDGTLIAFGGRVMNELIAWVRRDVDLKQREARLLEARARQNERSAEEEAQSVG